MRFVILMTLLLSGCAHRTKGPQIWRLTRCAKNGDTMVCECDKIHHELEAKTGRDVLVCE